MENRRCFSKPKQVTKVTAATSQITFRIEPPTPQRKFQRISLETDDLNQSVFYHESDAHTGATPTAGNTRHYGRRFKIFLLIVLWIVCSLALITSQERVQDMHQINIPRDSVKSYHISICPGRNKIKVLLKGAVLPYANGGPSRNLSVWVQLVAEENPSRVPENSGHLSIPNVDLVQNVSVVWEVPLADDDSIGPVQERLFNLASYRGNNTPYRSLRVQFKTNLNVDFPIFMGYNLRPIDPDDGVVYAALVLVGLYVVIISDAIHRTVAAMLASTLSVAILAALNERPTIVEIVSWIDIKTLLLLFSMMTLVTIFSETGIFDHTAVYAYKVTGGKLWPLINILCILATLTSCFMDNVTTALLITPVTIKLCEVMRLNPRQILMYTLIFSNIGGAITPIGDPPNVIIASNADVIKAGINFGVFTLHMGMGVAIVLIVVYVQLRIIYRDISHYKFDEPAIVQGLKREIAVWERTAASVGSYSRNEGAVKDSLIKTTAQLQDKLKLTLNNISLSEEDYSATLNGLQQQYPIRDKSLLVKSGVTLLLVIFMFFLHSIPALSTLGLGWTAYLGVLLLLILYDNRNIEGIFARIEWSTLLFFASLFILMEALARLGLIDWIGRQTEYVITSVGPESRLATAIILILWVTAVASAFVDNLPLTTMMIRIATDLSHNKELDLPLTPLIWSLSFGACLGGNGTLFGSSSNIVCAGVAEQHGYGFSFMQFMKIGLPVMLSTLCVTTVYLIVCHVVLRWH